MEGETMRLKILWAVIRTLWNGYGVSTSVGKVDCSFSIINKDKTYVHVRYKEGNLYE